MTKFVLLSMWNLESVFKLLKPKKIKLDLVQNKFDSIFGVYIFVISQES